jgi:Na+/alanine symporter
VRSAFGLQPAVAGVSGDFAAAMLNGVKRGFFSNEADMGIAPNSGATAPVPSRDPRFHRRWAYSFSLRDLQICFAKSFLGLDTGSDRDDLDVVNRPQVSGSPLRATAMSKRTRGIKTARSSRGALCAGNWASS